MYQYDNFDHRFVQERINQFSDQIARRLSGELTEDEFRPMRLMNGVYLQLHAYMLRVAIPYGSLSSQQMRQLAHIADKYDKGYGHFTTRQNIQYNWPKLVDMPEILSDLAAVEMHAIQTSGNCIRNITSDQWAGSTKDEIIDPRPICELLRQWSSLHPEFSYLPRKFKIAVTGSHNDRAAINVHDIGLQANLNSDGKLGYKVVVGGGLGRTPMIATTVKEWISEEELIHYLEAIMRVYNLSGRRDNKYKARIKILLHETGAEKFRELVEEEYSTYKQAKIAEGKYYEEVKFFQLELARIKKFFQPPAYEKLSNPDLNKELTNKEFHNWFSNNVTAHKVEGYSIVNVSLKEIGKVPGDITSKQMRVISDLADEYGFSEIRATHEQNLVIPDVKTASLYKLWEKLKAANLAEANIGLITDIISCPGLDYCTLATARSIPIAQEISKRFSDLEKQHEIGEIRIKISGCINACGHHHVGNIGILGLNKKGVEFYQLTLGGNNNENTAIGKILGPGFSAEEVPAAIEKIIETYINHRNKDEIFIDTVNRIGEKPFKEVLYAT